MRASTHSLVVLLMILAGAMQVCQAASPQTVAKPWHLGHFWITFWSPPPPEDRYLTTMYKERFNLTWGTEKDLDTSQRSGLHVLLQSPLFNPMVLDRTELREKLNELIDRVKSHPALEAYYLFDEPTASQFGEWARLVAYLKQRDPAHPSYINLLPIYASHNQLGTRGSITDAYRKYLRDFVRIVKPELLSYDHYHFFHFHDGTRYFLNLELIRQAARQANIPFINVIQACQFRPDRWRFPSAEEVRWQVYTTLAYGGQGISYFLYWGPTENHGIYQDGRPSPLVSPVSLLNRQIAGLGKQMIDLKSLGVYHTAPLPEGTRPIPADCPIQISSPGEYVLGLFATRSRPDTFMLVNRNYKDDVCAQLAIPTAKALIEFNRASGQWKRCSTFTASKSLKLELQPGDGRLFRFW